jgi:succinate dehydrogenase membrane anchor subunit
MVKSVLSVAHQGVRDWIIQRVSAIIMAIYTTILVVFFILHHPLTFTDWHDFMSSMWMKISTILFLLAMLYHAWIGLWTVFTDYIKPPVLRMLLNFLVLLLLFALLVWGVIIVGSV